VRVVVAVHDPPVWTLPDAQVSEIAARLPDDEVVGAREPEERRRAFPAADVIVTTRLKGEEFALARRLRWIHTTAVGVGPLLSPEAVASDVVITNARGSHSEAIAEHAIALVLALRRHLHIAAARQAAREWAQIEIQARRVPTLPHSRLLVVGLGSIGSRVAAHARGLGMQVTGVRRRLDQPVPPGVSEVVAPERLRDVLGRADAVVLAVPRTSETRALIGEPEFAAMRPSAVLVNIARGRLIDDAALIRALEAGKIAGAGLDAFQEEPLPASHPLWTAPNVMITPHTAAFAGDYWPPVVAQFLENMRRYKQGEPLINVVDKKAGY
jgi:phosphoglycerate dehydrogenase-like enzyme